MDGGEGAMTDFMSLAGNAEVVELTVNTGVPITKQTLAEAHESGLLNEEVRVIAIEREDTIITPTGDTKIEPDDLVTVFSQGGVSTDVLRVFTGEASSSEG
jgi:Trk K+ transport system NAD-binding subunit